MGQESPQLRGDKEEWAEGARTFYPFGDGLWCVIGLAKHLGLQAFAQNGHIHYFQLLSVLFFLGVGWGAGRM